MPRFALRLEYHGAGFVGWQRQAVGRSVQQVLEAAASRLAGGAAVAALAAGRTDAGVHASCQVACIDMPRDITAARLRDALNFHMKPHAVAVLDAAVAPAGWHPRFSAVERSYCYRILNRPARAALEAGLVWHVTRRLDTGAMQQAADTLLGRHDFTSFRAASCQAKSPLRTLDELSIRRDGERVLIAARARSFLHHQVRNMVGTLKLVGEGAWPPARVATALAARHRAAAGPTAPPEGLTLVGVRYTEDPFSRPECRALRTPG